MGLVQCWERIEKEGGSNPRVRLDFELKSEVQKAIYAARKEDPERDLNEIKQQVAAEQSLACSSSYSLRASGICI